MALLSGLQTTLSGMKVAQNQLDIISRNIANVDTEGYTRKTAQQNNVVFKSDRVKKMVKDGAQTAFDIWYLWDKSIYEDDVIFSTLLECVKYYDLTKFSSMGQKDKQFVLDKNN